MPTRSTLEIEYNGSAVELAVSLQGTADDLVLFLHGFGCAKESFAGAFHQESLADFSLCAFDFPGHGKSSRGSAFAYTLQEYADITNILLNLLSPERVFLVGHSMGGAVALVSTQERRDVGCLVSVEGNLVGEDCGIVSRSTAAQSAAEFISEGCASFVATLRNSGQPDSQAWAHWYSQAEPLALHESARSLVEWSDNGKLLDLFHAMENTSYVYGTRDSKEYLMPYLGRSSSYRIPRAGHFVMLDNPRAFYSTLASILHAAAEPPGSGAPVRSRHRRSATALPPADPSGSAR